MWSSGKGYSRLGKVTTKVKNIFLKHKQVLLCQPTHYLPYVHFYFKLRLVPGKVKLVEERGGGCSHFADHFVQYWNTTELHPKVKQTQKCWLRLDQLQIIYIYISSEVSGNEWVWVSNVSMRKTEEREKEAEKSDDNRKQKEHVAIRKT